MLFNKYERCRGITLFARNNLRIELWFVPKGQDIRPHTHPNIDSFIVFLYGSVIFRRKKPNESFARHAFLNSRNDRFRSFHVAPEDVHYFEDNTVKPLIFLNIEIWKGNGKSQSASKDFKVTTD